MAVAIAGWLSVVVLLILSAVTAPPAAAHGGPMVIFPSVDGTGRVIATSAALRRYRGLELGDGGRTPADDTTYANPFGFSAQDRPGKPGC